MTLTTPLKSITRYASDPYTCLLQALALAPKDNSTAEILERALKESVASKSSNVLLNATNETVGITDWQLAQSNFAPEHLVSQLESAYREKRQNFENAGGNDVSFDQGEDEEEDDDDGDEMELASSEDEDSKSDGGAKLGKDLASPSNAGPTRRSTRLRNRRSSPISSQSREVETPVRTRRRNVVVSSVHTRSEDSGDQMELSE